MPAVTPIWTRKTAQAPPVTEEAIVEAALRLLDEEGFGAITMRAVAERLGVTPPTIYWHIDSKDGLLDRLLDRLCADVAPSPLKQKWDDRLRQIAQAMREVFAAHRDAVHLAIGRFPLGPNGLRVTELVLAALAEAGLAHDEVAYATYVFFNYVVAFCHLETITPIAAFAESRADALKSIEQYLVTLPPQQFPQINRYAKSLTAQGLDRRFAFGLNQLLLGLEATARKERNGKTPTRERAGRRQKAK
jgi:AcrR family transcriptional regulator